MRLKSFLLIGFGASLTACNTLSAWQQDKVFSDARNGRDVCGMKYLEPYLGLAFDDLNIRDHLPEKFSYRVADPRPFLAGGSDQIFTTELRPRRQNISLDAQGHIISLECG